MPRSEFPREWTRLLEIAQRIEEIVQRFEDGDSLAELVQGLMEARAELHLGSTGRARSGTALPRH